MTVKNIKQQIASAQERLYFLEAKKKHQTKKKILDRELFSVQRLPKYQDVILVQLIRLWFLGFCLNCLSLMKTIFNYVGHRGKPI